MPKRTEGQYEKAYKDLVFYVKAKYNLCDECKDGVEREVRIIERKLREGIT